MNIWVVMQENVISDVHPARSWMSLHICLPVQFYVNFLSSFLYETLYVSVFIHVCGCKLWGRESFDQ